MSMREGPEQYKEDILHTGEQVVWVAQQEMLEPARLRLTSVQETAGDRAQVGV